MTIFLRIESTIWRPESVLVKRAVKTCKLHRCDVENYEDTLATIVKKGKISKKGLSYCVAGTPNDVSYKNNTHIPGISIYYFPNDVAVWPKWTRFNRRHRGDFTLRCRRSCAPLAGFEDCCYEHIPLDKSGEDNQ